MNAGSSTNTALLVQVLDQLGGIRQDIGGIKSQLQHGARQFELIGEQIGDIEQRQTTIEESVAPLVESMAIMGPKITTMEKFLGKKLGPIVAVSSTVVAVALWLIALSVGAAVTWAKANLSTHLHWSEWHVTAFAFIGAFLPGYSRTGSSPPPLPPSSSPPRTTAVVRDIYDQTDGDL